MRNTTILQEPLQAADLRQAMPLSNLDPGEELVAGKARKAREGAGRIDSKKGSRGEPRAMR